ncbi:MAG: VCBS repeat-containing protein [Ruminococcaceae bacterium]|nr:VCBS repeat-containing protein [Oscillospiraceae bacterium]
MKLRAVAMALVMAVTLSGCSFIGLDAQTLMHPPKPTGEKADIHALLESKTDGKMTLKYPKSGDYRSAIITHDLCGDKNDEAMAIYQKEDETSGTNIMFMKKDGKWVDMGSFSNPAAQVDKVCFGDLDGDGKSEVVVGWGSSLNNTSTICVYYYKNGKMNELKLEQTYTELAVMDFDGDGRDEIFTANTSVGDQPALARLFRVKDGAVEVMGSCRMDGGVTKYASVKSGLINEHQNGIVLDGIKNEGSLVTELLYWDQKTKRLRSPFYDVKTQTANYTMRNTSVVSKDINGDKIIEVPIVNLMPGHSGEKTDDADYITNWHRYDTQTGTFVRVMSMVLNYSDGYWFLIPDMWRGKVTTKTDTVTRMITFYRWNAAGKNSGSLGPALLKIQVFSQKEWDSGTGTAGFYKLLDSDNLVFAASSPSPTDALSLSIGDVKNSFELISQD